MKTRIVFLKLSDAVRVLGISAKGSRNLDGKSKFATGIQDETNAAAVIHKLPTFPGLTPLKNTKTSGCHSSTDLFSKSASCKASFPFEVCFLFYCNFLLRIHLGKNWPLHPQAAVAISQAIRKPLMKFTRQRVSAASTTIM